MKKIFFISLFIPQLIFAGSLSDINGKIVKMPRGPGDPTFNQEMCEIYLRTGIEKLRISCEQGQKWSDNNGGYFYELENGEKGHVVRPEGGIRGDSGEGEDDSA
jgi:hypothetical protein